MENSLLVIENGKISVVAEALSKYQKLKEQQKEIETQVKEIETQLKTELKEICYETTKVGNFNYIVSGGFYNVDFDFESFKKENPLLYLKYLKPKQSKETCKLTFGKGK